MKEKTNLLNLEIIRNLYYFVFNIKKYATITFSSFLIFCKYRTLPQFCIWIFEIHSERHRGYSFAPAWFFKCETFLFYLFF